MHSSLIGVAMVRGSERNEWGMNEVREWGHHWQRLIEIKESKGDVFDRDDDDGGGGWWKREKLIEKSLSCLS